MRYENRNKRWWVVISLLFLLALPLVGSIYVPNMDIRNFAGVDDGIYNAKCFLKSVYVNPSTLQVGTPVKIELQVSDEINNTDGVASAYVLDAQGNMVKDFSKEKQPFLFDYTPAGAGDLNLFATVETKNGKKYACVNGVISAGRLNPLQAVLENHAPQIITSPYKTATPIENSLRIGESYRYVMSVIDRDNDNIQYIYSFTPGEDWLASSVTKSVGGELQLSFAGVPTKPGSYLANVMVYDGYTNHLRSQSWTINVDPIGNDIPVVKIVSPLNRKFVRKGDTLKISWDASDANQILNYRVYLVKNVSNEQTWTLLKALSYKYNTYLWTVGDTIPGDYFIVVEADDNQNPVATGRGVSREVVSVVSDDSKESISGTTPLLSQPQILNIVPRDKSILSQNDQVKVSALLVPSQKSVVQGDSVKLTVDGVLIATENFKLIDKDGASKSLVYTANENWSVGEHKVEIEFEDSEGDKASRYWTFSVVEAVTQGKVEEDSNVYTIFGKQINKKTLTIILVGVILIILALVIPWIFYIVWGNSRDSDDSEYFVETPPTTPVQPSPTNSMSASSTNDDVFVPIVHVNPKKEVVNNEDYTITSSGGSSRSATTDYESSDLIPEPPDINHKPADVKQGISDDNLRNPDINTEVVDINHMSSGVISESHSTVDRTDVGNSELTSVPANQEVSIPDISNVQGVDVIVEPKQASNEDTSSETSQPIPSDSQKSSFDNDALAELEGLVKDTDPSTKMTFLDDVDEKADTNAGSSGEDVGSPLSS